MSVLLLIDHDVLLIYNHISMLLLIDYNVTINRSWCTINIYHINMLLLIDYDQPLIQRDGTP